jgi:hypothetical protein
MTHFLYRSQQSATSEFLKDSGGSGNGVDYDAAEATIPGPASIDTQNRGHSLHRKY